MRNLIIVLLFLGAVAALPQAYKNVAIKNQFPAGQDLTADSSSVLIVGGRDAQPGEFPWQVSLQSLTGGVMTHNCAGTIIDETHIVTASHCDDSGYEVVAGAHSIQRNETTQQRIPALRFTPHPEFDLDLVRNDIAVITLSRPLVFNDRVKPLRLPTANVNPVGQLCTTIGWGNANPTGDNPPIYPDVLQAVNLTIIRDEKCQELYSESYLDETMVCAHYSAGGRSACTYDSGGSLICSDVDGPYIVGIASWVQRPCGQAQFPTVFSRVSENLDFIESVLSHEQIPSTLI